MAVWTVGAFIDALKANLITRLGTESLSSVEVFTGPPGMDEVDDDREFIVLGISIDADENHAAIGQNPARNEEVNVIECALSAWEVQDQGGGEVAVKAARDRALAILDVVETELRTTPKQGLTESVRLSHISRKKMEQGVAVDQHGRICLIEFDLTVAVRTNV